MDDFKWLKEALDKLESKVDRLDQRLDTMEVIHAKNTAQLDEHIYRTELAEENIALLREEVSPIQKHVAMVGGVLKFIGLLGVLAGILEAMTSLANYLKI